MGTHKRMKMLIDCDAGTDDGVAILMALAQRNVEVVGITTVFGNASLENSSYNVLRLLNFMDRVDIPVFRGCEASLLGHSSPGNGYHGDDSFGDISAYPANHNLCQEEHAVQALLRIVNEHPGEITLVATGPLTNLALAVRIDPDFGKKLKESYIMGGNTTALGSLSLCGEFNFYCDPEAAQIVLTQLKTSITLLPLELCLHYSFSWEWYDKFISTPTRKAKFVKDIEAKMVMLAKTKYSQPRYYLWDQLAMAVAIDNNVAMETEEVYATVELHGSHTRSQTVVDWKDVLKRPPNVTLVTRVNVDLYEKMLYQAVGQTTELTSKL